MHPHRSPQFNGQYAGSARLLTFQERGEAIIDGAKGAFRAGARATLCHSLERVSFPSFGTAFRTPLPQVEVPSSGPPGEMPSKWWAAPPWRGDPCNPALPDNTHGDIAAMGTALKVSNGSDELALPNCGGVGSRRVLGLWAMAHRQRIHRLCASCCPFSFGLSSRQSVQRRNCQPCIGSS